MTGTRRQDRGVRGAGAAVRADRDDAHRRDRDLARARRDLDRRRVDPPHVASRARGRGSASGSTRPRASCSPRGSSAAVRRARARRAARRSRRSRSRLPADVDPIAVVVASRRAGEPWFCFEQPDRDGAALAGARLRARDSRRAGRDRFARVAARWRALAAGGDRRPPDGPRGAGLVAVGGFAFAPDGGARAALGGLRARVAARARGRARAPRRRRAADASPRSRRPTTPPRTCSRGSSARLAELRAARRCRCSTRRRPGASASLSAMPPEHYEGAVARAVERIRAGALEKVVLAREVQVHAPRDARPRRGARRAARRRSRRATSSAVGRGEATFVGASPSCSCAATASAPRAVALAGSTRRSADPAVDDHLGEQLLRSDKDREEQAIVARRIAQRAAPARGVGDGARPSRCSCGSRTSSTSRRRSARSCRSRSARWSSPALLHPTPAVGGEPFARAEPLIPQLEGLDRGWYAGPVGWTDANGDGEFCVALRCALLRGAGRALLRRRRRRARLRSRRPSWPRPRSSCRRCCRCWLTAALTPATVRSPATPSRR